MHYVVLRVTPMYAGGTTHDLEAGENRCVRSIADVCCLDAGCRCGDDVHESGREGVYHGERRRWQRDGSHGHWYEDGRQDGLYEQRGQDGVYERGDDEEVMLLWKLSIP